MQQEKPNSDFFENMVFGNLARLPHSGPPFRIYPQIKGTKTKKTPLNIIIEVNWLSLAARTSA